jgi:hypothetical protein
VVYTCIELIRTRESLRENEDKRVGNELQSTHRRLQFKYGVRSPSYRHAAHTLTPSLPDAGDVAKPSRYFPAFA